MSLEVSAPYDNSYVTLVIMPDRDGVIADAELHFFAGPGDRVYTFHMPQSEPSSTPAGALEVLYDQAKFILRQLEFVDNRFLSDNGQRQRATAEKIIKMFEYKVVAS
jgi:hypothetical protein